MKTIIVAGLSLLTLVSLSWPGEALDKSYFSKITNGMGNRLPERFEEEFRSNLENKSSGMAQEAFYENHNGLGNQ